MFSEKITQIFTLLGITSADFSRFTGCDKSYISHIKNSAKVPKNGGKGAWRIVSGIYLYADENGKVDELCDLIHCGNRGSADEIKSSLMAWLYDGGAPAKSEMPKDKTPYRAFGEKLGALMELTALSNVRLGRSLSIDSSYISRFRSGFRSPKSNPKIMNDLWAVILDRAIDQGKMAALVKLIGAVPEELDDKEKSFRKDRTVDECQH